MQLQKLVWWFVKAINIETPKQSIETTTVPKEFPMNFLKEIFLEISEKNIKSVAKKSLKLIAKKQQFLKKKQKQYGLVIYKVIAW